MMDDRCDHPTLLLVDNERAPQQPVERTRVIVAPLTETLANGNPRGAVQRQPRNETASLDRESVPAGSVIRTDTDTTRVLWVTTNHTASRKPR
jgi:hypothetical protein